jgi:hypothetical protein
MAVRVRTPAPPAAVLALPRSCLVRVARVRVSFVRPHRPTPAALCKRSCLVRWVVRRVARRSSHRSCLVRRTGRLPNLSFHCGQIQHVGPGLAEWLAIALPVLWLWARRTDPTPDGCSGSVAQVGCGTPGRKCTPFVLRQPHAERKTSCTTHKNSSLAVFRIPNGLTPSPTREVAGICLGQNDCAVGLGPRAVNGDAPGIAPVASSRGPEKMFWRVRTGGPARAFTEVPFLAGSGKRRPAADMPSTALNAQKETLLAVFFEGLKVLCVTMPSIRRIRLAAGAASCECSGLDAPERALRRFVVCGASCPTTAIIDSWRGHFWRSHLSTFLAGPYARRYRPLWHPCHSSRGIVPALHGTASMPSTASMRAGSWRRSPPPGGVLPLPPPALKVSRAAPPPPFFQRAAPRAACRSSFNLLARPSRPVIAKCDEALASADTPGFACAPWSPLSSRKVRQSAGGTGRGIQPLWKD